MSSHKNFFFYSSLWEKPIQTTLIILCLTFLLGTYSYSANDKVIFLADLQVVVMWLSLLLTLKLLWNISSTATLELLLWCIQKDLFLEQRINFWHQISLRMLIFFTNLSNNQHFERNFMPKNGLCDPLPFQNVFFFIYHSYCSKVTALDVCHNLMVYTSCKKIMYNLYAMHSILKCHFLHVEFVENVTCLK